MIRVMLRTCLLLCISGAVLWAIYGVMWFVMIVWPITTGVTLGALVVVAFTALVTGEKNGK